MHTFMKVKKFYPIFNAILVYHTLLEKLQFCNDGIKRCPSRFMLYSSIQVKSVENMHENRVDFPDIKLIMNTILWKIETWIIQTTEKISNNLILKPYSPTKDLS